MNFFPHASIEVPRQKHGLVADDKESLNSFWERVDTEIEENLSAGIGCYILSIRAGKGALPWYVGLAEKQSFRKECFTSHKLVHYNKAIIGRKGTPLLTLIAKYTLSGSIVTPTGGAHRDIQFLEKLLIANCISRNANLCNVRDTKLLREMTVHGLLNTPQGKPVQSVFDFQALVGV